MMLEHQNDKQKKIGSPRDNAEITETKRKRHILITYAGGDDGTALLAGPTSDGDLGANDHACACGQ